MLRRPAILCAGLLFAAVLVLGLARLFELRFQQGDLYPAYSTLRADPLGASVFYESLDAVPGVTTERYFEETFRQDDGQDRALFVLGSGPSYYESFEMLPRSEFDTVQRFVFNGGRIVIAYRPEVREPWWASHANTNQTGQSPSGDDRPHRHHPSESDADENGSETNRADRAVTASATNTTPATNRMAVTPHRSSRNARRHAKSQDGQEQKQDEDDEDLRKDLRHYADLSAEWGYRLAYENLETNEDNQVQFPNARLVAAGRSLPALLPLHTAIYFTNLTNGWTAIYERGKKQPVVIERKFGAGSVVLVADAYPFSNEALFKDRNAPLLAWFLGSGRKAIFDEAHLGISEEPGVATLMRRYQLHGLIFSLLLLAGLFVWKNSAGLVPPYAEPDAGHGIVVAGRDSASGLVNLARRGIPPADLINVCYAEWKKSSPRLAALSPSQRRDLEQLVRQQAALEPRRRKPVENYRVISQILRRRN